MPKQKGYFPDTYSIRLPEGLRDKFERAAKENSQSPAEWVREAIREALKAQRTDGTRKA